MRVPVQDFLGGAGCAAPREDNVGERPIAPDQARLKTQNLLAAKLNARPASEPAATPMTGQAAPTAVKVTRAA